MDAADYVRFRRPSVGNYMYGEEASKGIMEGASKGAMEGKRQPMEEAREVRKEWREQARERGREEWRKKVSNQGMASRAGCRVRQDKKIKEVKARKLVC